jgi:hypothetical protein
MINAWEEQLVRMEYPIARPSLLRPFAPFNFKADDPTRNCSAIEPQEPHPVWVNHFSIDSELDLMTDISCGPDRNQESRIDEEWDSKLRNSLCRGSLHQLVLHNCKDLVDDLLLDATWQRDIYT